MKNWFKLKYQQWRFRLFPEKLCPVCKKPKLLAAFKESRRNDRRFDRYVHFSVLNACNHYLDIITNRYPFVHSSRNQQISHLISTHFFLLSLLIVEHLLHNLILGLVLTGISVPHLLHRFVWNSVQSISETFSLSFNDEFCPYQPFQTTQHRLSHTTSYSCIYAQS